MLAAKTVHDMGIEKVANLAEAFPRGKPLASNVLTLINQRKPRAVYLSKKKREISGR